MAGSATALLTAERRQVTALFCDLVDSTALSHRLDAEDFHETMRAFRGCCAAVVERYEGCIADYSGDGCLVLFGYPRAHEDAPARAVRTGLELAAAIEALPLPDDQRIAARIGIATGVVVVEPGTPEGRTVGESVNLASRLQSIARPGAVLVAGLTRELTGALFEYEDLGTVALKGFSCPVATWRAVKPSAVASRFEALRSQTLTPFVGRQAELRMLASLWDHAAAGNITTLLLSGDAGIGKSRLLRQLNEQIAGRVGEVLRFHCSPYHTNTALYPFIEACGRIAVTASDDPPAALLNAVRHIVEPLGPEWQRHLPGLTQLLSIPQASGAPPPTPRQSKQQTIDALAWWLQSLARQGPVIAVMEDAHWIDPSSLELLELAVSSLERLPVLLVITSRTDLGVRWRPRAAISAIALERLSPDESLALIAKVDNAGRLDRALAARIAANADGVPLFIEELTRTALEQQPTPGGRGGLPATLRDSLLLRLDQLASARPVAQIAAVIGREFSIDLLAAVSGIAETELRQRLVQLGDRGFVFPTGKSDGRSWAFKHGLVREAAYESLLKQDRRQLHARVAAALEAGRPADNIGQAEMLAHHHTEAGAVEPALRNWGLAAQQAYRRSANLEVIGHAGRALALLEGVPASPQRDRNELQLQLLLGGACWATKGFASLEVERAFTRAIELSIDGTPGASPVEVLRGLYGCYYARGELASAWRQAERVAEAARRIGGRGDRMVMHLLFGQLHFWRGEFTDARRELEAALAHYDPGEQQLRPMSMQIDPAVNARMHLGWTLWALGFPDRALAAVETATADARRPDQPFSLAMALFWEAAVKGCCGLLEQSRAVTAELRSVTAEHEIAYLGACATVLEGGGLIAAGDVDAGMIRLRRAFVEFGRQQAGLGWPWALSLAISGCVRSGRTADGLAMLREAAAAMERNGERMWEAEIHRLEADLLAGDAAGAVEALNRASAVARRQGALSLELRAAASLARLRGDTTALADLVGRFSEGFETADLRAARALLAGAKELT
jgi:class 3 adenylate cyclase/tetratricopeptide (TPR) repeat protein